MGDVLGVGLSHYPPLSGLDAHMADVLHRTLADPGIPAATKDPTSWPELARTEWGQDQGRRAAAEHRSALIDGFRRIRVEIDDFEPDVVIIWGDDQYENFREDVIPPYAVLAYADLEVRPWAQAAESSAMKGKQNIWGEGPDTAFTIRGRPDIGKHLTTELLAREMDVAYAYKQLHHPSLPHAFLNAILYLDYERRGFAHPVLCFPLNCYGRRVISYQGFMSAVDDVRDLDPPSPSPSRLMDLGAVVGKICLESPWRVVLMASSSWSHAFLCDRTWRLRPDTASDQRLYKAMSCGSLEEWRSTPLEEIEAAGQQELLNWYPLLGAMQALGATAPAWSEFVETGIFNSNKVFAAYPVVSS
jgi:hypothetical protein